jgi:hypothetical protein
VSKIRVVPPDHPLVDTIIVPDALAAWPMSPTRAGLAMSCMSQDLLEDELVER